MFHRIGNKLFIDKREDSAFDFLTVNETSHDPPSTETPEDINSAQSLSQEATMINQNFSQQILQGEGGKKLDFPEANPFQGIFSISQIGPLGGRVDPVIPELLAWGGASPHPSVSVPESLAASESRPRSTCTQII